MKQFFKDAVEEKQWKTCELHEFLGCDYCDIEQISSNVYKDIRTNKLYEVLNKRKKHVFTIKELV